MKTVVFAYNNIGCTGIKSLIENGYDIQAVFTHIDSPNETIWFDSVAQVASENNIPVYAPEDVNHPIWIQKIKELQPEVIFSFYYRNILKQDILDIPTSGAYNLHGSLLPKYRGRCPINWVLVNGETETGVTLHHMTARPDDGDIIAQNVITIEDADNAKTLSIKANKAAAELLKDILPKISDGTAPKISQDSSKASYFGGRKPTDGEINWNDSAETTRNLVRAVTLPWPGAYSFIGTNKCFFWDVEVVEDNNGKPLELLYVPPP